MMRPTIALLLLGWLSLFPASMDLAAAEPARLDLSAWRQIPVLHHGRLMPLDSFARQAVDIICDRTNPKLGLKGAVPEDELNSEAFAEARTLFPAGPNDKPEAGAARRFEAAELLLSWLTEPEKWEDVPFIVAEHDELREKYLDAPVTNEKGEHLRYVSPRQIEEASALHEALAGLRQRRRQAMMKEEEFVGTGLDKKLTDLQQAYSLYRSLTFSPEHQVTLPRQEAVRIESRLLQKFDGLVQTWSSLTEGLRGLPMLGEDGEIEAGQKSLAGIYDLVNKPDASAAEIEPHLQQFLDSALALAKTLGRMRKNLLSNPSDEHLAKFDPRQLDQFRSLFREFDDQANKIVKQAQEVRIALYDNGDCLHVVPALNPYALEKNREREDDAHPWLSLQAVLYGSPELLRDYPQAKLAEVRDSFAKLSKAYAARPSAAEADEVALAARSLAGGLRDLAESIEPKREKL
ncbi:MAG TPA: hypothetical protein VN699_19580, partial [Pirellulales bacterium]|nr:hypothetical protein [Pirellulales bacterium]